MIDRSKPLTEQPPGELRALIDGLRANRERYDHEGRVVEARSCDLEIGEATRALAILNRRATKALDAQSPDGIRQDEVDALLAVLRGGACLPEREDLVSRMWAAIQTMQSPLR